MEESDDVIMLEEEQTHEAPELHNLLDGSVLKRRIRKVRRIKIRKLAIKDEPKDKMRRAGWFTRRVNRFCRCWSFLSTRNLFIFLCTLTLGIMSTKLWYADKEIVSDVIDEFNRQYNLHNYGDMNYCKKPFNSSTHMEPIKQRLVNQEEAINLFGQTIENYETFDIPVTSIALIGTTGVGKTLTTNSFQIYFPWQSNIFPYTWSLTDDHDTQLINIQKIIQQLKLCGHNLIIVDGVPGAPQHNAQQTIINFNEQIHQFVERNRSTKNQNYRVLVFYNINIPNFTDNDRQQIVERQRQFQNLPNINSINYKTFNDKIQLINCINLEARAKNVRLTQNQINEIVASIDIQRSGCKNVLAKVSTYLNLPVEFNNDRENVLKI